MPSLVPRLCAKHARIVRYDEPGGLAVQPPVGHESCSMCRAEAEQKTDPLEKLAAGTRTHEHTITAEEPDSYVVQSDKASYLLDVRDDALRRVRRAHDAAVSVLDAERPFVQAIDHAQPGPERRKAFDRHKRHVNGGGRRRRSLDVIVHEDGIDFDAAMDSAQEARDRIIAALEIERGAA